MKSASAPFRETLRNLHGKYSQVKTGRVASYIPELAKADPEWFGISVVTVDGLRFDVGEADRPFSIQSISKPFIFGLALEDHGRDHVLSKVGVEPTGEAFNSIVLDEATNRPFNPMVNAGAIATTDLIKGADQIERYKRMLEMFRKYVGREVHVDSATFLSERSTGHRNRAIAHLMLNFGMIEDRVDETLELYFQQCSVLVDCHDLALMGATLANGGVNPATGERALEAPYVKDLLSIMLSCGSYDFAGEWTYRIGLPAKSGVSGGILAVVPGVAGIAVFSPSLDEKGNSVRGVLVCKELSERFGLHILEAGRPGKALEDEIRPSRKSS
ncbi:glutaminase A [Paludisphaera rhizosphaerae]|uniref:glutaminase A n=1 Tax=Paludisphaera rhizosphaerae TaxID=2711216 RepID=UPI0013EDB65F